MPVPKKTHTHIDTDIDPTIAFMRSARPDALDHRDRRYRPNLGQAPAPSMFPARGLTVKNQHDTMACTGFSLSLVIEHLLRSAEREARPSISPFMLYSMARRYDEYAGSIKDKGSSLRGVMKGWFKHGACHASLFPELEMPQNTSRPEDDWWLDAVKRPLGAYYRVDTKVIADMHAALNEVGILLASASCHAGWDEGIEVPTRKTRPTSFKGIWEIPVRPSPAAHQGHAFAIVGYNERGFLIQNSWGAAWGSHGYALLSYDDWLRNAMDCWVAQLGVVTREHAAISKAPSLRAHATTGSVSLSTNEVLRNREIAPFILNMASDGSLSDSGEFRTRPADVRAMVDVHLAAARKRWHQKDEVVDVCIFAHGGLVGENAAARVAAQWIPMLYEHKVFPIFLMWESDFFSAALACIEKAIHHIPQSAAADEDRWWNDRLERLLARPGTRLWSELKQNADAMSNIRPGVDDDAQAGVELLYRHLQQQAGAPRIRLHLVAHSAGSLMAASWIDRLVTEGLRFESVSFMAPALTVQAFEQQLLPHLRSRAIQRYQQFHLSDRAERDDYTCGAYRRSLLYLVSQSFEGGGETPVIGMQKYFDAQAGDWPRTTVHVAPGSVSAASTHGSFDSDPGTRAQIVKFILK